MRRRLGSFALLALLLAVAPADARKEKPTPCPDGRFRVVGEALVPGGAVPLPDAIVVAAPQLAIASGCEARKGRVKATRKKGTLLKAKWKQCGELRKVVLVATIASPACDVVTGTIKAKKMKKRRIEALRSACGDGVLDAGNGEQCDGSASGCAGGQHCNATCGCEAGTTTTTLPGAGQVGLCGNAVIETGEPCDLLSDPSGCPTGQQCDLVDRRCVCSVVPDVIGEEVSYSPPPRPNLAALGLPQNLDGTFALLTPPNAELRIDPTIADPVTAAARCGDWVTGCLAPPARSLDDCARSAPHCTTNRPWDEAAACCPAACFTAYEAKRRQGASAMLAWRQVYRDDGSCFPGLRALLGRP